MRWSDGNPSPQTISSSGTTTSTGTRSWSEPAPEFQVNGKPGVLSARDDYTVVYEFSEPYYLFVDILAGDTLIGGGQATKWSYLFMGTYAPAHYLKQFLPKYSSADEVTRKAKAAGFDSWVSYLRNRTNWTLNAELPVLGPWKTVTPINTPTWSLERNPYYWAVDTAGNQLPYIDRIVMTLAENLEVLNLRAVAGEYDLQERHTTLPKLPSSSRTRRRAITASTWIPSSSDATPDSWSTRPTRPTRRSPNGSPRATFAVPSHWRRPRPAQ